MAQERATPGSLLLLFFFLILEAQLNIGWIVAGGRAGILGRDWFIRQQFLGCLLLFHHPNSAAYTSLFPLWNAVLFSAPLLIFFLRQKESIGKN